MNTIYVSVEGFQVDVWRSSFETALRGADTGENFTVFLPSVPGSAAAARGDQAGVRYVLQTSDDPWKKAGVIIQALALAASLAQAKPTSPASVTVQQSVLSCVIQGEKGTTTLLVEGGKVDETLLRTCLQNLGEPKHISLKHAPSQKTPHAHPAKKAHEKKPVGPKTHCE